MSDADARELAAIRGRLLTVLRDTHRAYRDTDWLLYARFGASDRARAQRLAWVLTGRAYIPRSGHADSALPLPAQRVTRLRQHAQNTRHALEE